VLARASAEVELGDEIDIDGLRKGKGGVMTLTGSLRPLDSLEIEPTYARRWVNGEDSRLYTEQALAINAILHFGVRDSLRLIAQSQRTERNRAHYPLRFAPKSLGSTFSLVYGHTAGIGKAMYVGLTKSDGDTPGYESKRVQNELFVKLSWQN
jgi:hypothetical protein